MRNNTGIERSSVLRVKTMKRYKTLLSSYVAEVDLLLFIAGIIGHIMDDCAEFGWPDSGSPRGQVKTEKKIYDSLGNDDHAELCNFAMHSQIKSVSVYLNGQHVKQIHYVIYRICVQ